MIHPVCYNCGRPWIEHWFANEAQYLGEVWCPCTFNPINAQPNGWGRDSTYVPLKGGRTPRKDAKAEYEQERD